MKLLATIREADVTSEPLPKNTAATSRQAARAVLLNNKEQVALLKVGQHGYHKLPGGGIESGEDISKALERELLEETGCRATVVAEVGKVVEYRDRWGLKQTSYCYVARQSGQAGTPSFTEKEMSEGFELIWVDGIESAIQLLSRDKPDNYEGLFIRQRDIKLLEAARNLIPAS